MHNDLAEFLNLPPDPERPYMYRGTRTRTNKFGILNPDALDLVARALSDLRTELLQFQPITGHFDLAHLCAIHRYLFQDVYSWAGEIRIVDFNIADPEDGGPRQPMYLPESEIVAAANALFTELSQERERLSSLSQTEFADRIAYYLLELYWIHPFRDGNGRAIRVFLKQLANENGWRFDLDTVSQKERHSTAKAVWGKGDKGPLREVVRRVVRPLDDSWN